jgi:hypothetical protein
VATGDGLQRQHQLLVVVALLTRATCSRLKRAGRFPLLQRPITGAGPSRKA